MNIQKIANYVVLALVAIAIIYWGWVKLYGTPNNSVIEIPNDINGEVFDNSNEVIRDLDENGLVTLASGETVLEVSDRGPIAVKYLGLVEDYRCVGADCPEAGAVVASVQIDTMEGTSVVNFPSDEVPQVHGGYKVSIVNLPPKLEGETADPELTFKLELIN